MNLSIKTRFSIFLGCVLCFVFGMQIVAQQTASPIISTVNSCGNLQIDEFFAQQIASDKINNLYFIKNENLINSVNLVNGNVNWTFDTGGSVFPRLVADDRYVYVFNSVTKRSVDETAANKVSGDSLVFRAISQQTGLPVWKTEIEFARGSNHSDSNKSGWKDTFGSSYLAETDEAILFGTDSCLGRLDKASGEIEWKSCIAANSPIRNFVLNSSKKILGFTDDNHIYLLATANGDLKLKIPVETKISALALIDDSTIVYGDKKGNVRFLGSEGSKTDWAIKCGGEISGITISERNLLVSSLDNFVYLLDGSKGRTIWKKRFPGRIKDRPFLKNDIAVIVGDESNAFFVSVTDGKTMYRVSLPPEVSYLKPALFVDEYYFFLTDKGILAYADESCRKKESQKKESGKAPDRSAFD
jgi:outer membrane protein assembly factor BamB